MRIARREFERIGKRAVAGLHYTGWGRSPFDERSVNLGSLYYRDNLEESWAASSWRTVEAVLALCRLGEAIGTHEIDRLLDEAARAAPHVAAGEFDMAVLKLAWARFDQCLPHVPLPTDMGRVHR
jgi:hypothetical protein